MTETAAGKRHKVTKIIVSSPHIYKPVGPYSLPNLIVWTTAQTPSHSETKSVPRDEPVISINDDNDITVKKSILSQAILVDHTLYVSGVLGLDPQAKLVDGGAEAQTQQALANLKHVLEAGGSSLDAVVKTTLLLGNIDDFETVNEVYGQFFTKDFPARATFQVAKLPLGAAVEIEAIALSGDLAIAEAGPCPCSK